MCGVIAAWTPTPLAREARAAALVSLSHRGPDGSGEALLDGGSVYLGHTRLAIIAPEDGRQPLESEDGAIHAVVNGEIYGFETQRRDLEARGHHFRTRSDSEVVVHHYEERGLPFVDDLRGELAFVLWDGHQRRLVAGRDRFGVKPLCFAEHGGGLYLASEAKALFALGVPAAWDEEAFLHAAVHQYLPADRTLFAGVRQVPPGHFLVAEQDRSPRLVKYWDLDLQTREAETRTHGRPEDAVASVRAALEDTVRARLRSDVPVAFALSGGLDSATLAGLGARHASGAIHTFGVTFDHALYDEEEAALAAAAHVGAVHHRVHVSQDDLIDALPDAVAHGEGLAINGQLPAKLLLARAVRDAGFSVILTGEGADELFYGYPHLAEDLASTLPPDEARRIRARLAANHDASRGVMLPREADEGDLGGLLAPIAARLGSVPTFLRAKVGFGQRFTTLLDGDASARLMARPPLGALVDGLDVEGQLRGRHPVAQSAYLWTRLALAGYILRTLGDGTEMAASIEGRPPFLDHRLHAVSRELPIGLKIRGGVEKHVLREVARGVVPESTRRKPKHPFLAPPLALHATPRARSLVRDVLGSDAIRDVPFVDRHRVSAFLDDLDGASAAERSAAEPILFTLLTACLLARRFSLRDVL